MNNLKELKSKFINYIQLDKNYSPKTIENYSLWLDRFLDYILSIKKKNNLAEINWFDISDFRAFLSSEWLSKKTINYHIIAVRSFIKFLNKNNEKTFPLELLELSRLDPREITFLEQEEVNKILSMPDKFEKNKLKRLRDKSILLVLYWSWLRVSELISLKLDQVNFKKKQLKVVGKWKKERAVFLTNQAIQTIKEYLSLRTDNSEFLFISLSKNSYWKPLTRVSVENLVRDYASLAWVKKKVTPHTLRHSFATTLLQRWADIRSVQELLGHSNITTTQIYTHISDKHLEEVHSLLDDDL
jgi:site-specific recombinase XerD